MKKASTFTIAGITNSGKQIEAQALHSASLTERKGYDENFLGTALALPKPGSSLKKDVAVLQKDIGPHGDRIFDYTHFSLVFNQAKKLPFYTAVNIGGTTNLMGVEHEERGTDVWLPDERTGTPKKYGQYGNGDYRASGFQRGHMVRFYDPAWGNTPAIKKTAMGDTFHYTNCCPQIPYYNSVVWNYLEDYYMARSIFTDKKITVFSGPIFNKAKTINGLLVPLNFWKVVVYKKSATKLAAMGFIMSHEKYFDRLKTEKTLVAQKMVQPTLTRSSVDTLYAKKELIDAKVKISLIESKTSIRFGLNAVDEKAKQRPDNIELISTGKLAAAAFDPKEQKAMRAFFMAI